jgi:hypothetical protein
MRSLFLMLAVIQGAVQPSSILAAASKFVPGVTWQANSVVAADLSCRGRKEQAILGVSPTEIVVAVFLNGLKERPEVLRYSAEARDAATAKLTIEKLNKDEIGPGDPAFPRSRTCKGLNLSDGKIDSAHIFWDPKARRFNDWVQ